MKRTTQWVLLIAMSPVAALAGFGRFEAVYSFFAHTLALLPGILGVFMRAAYYRLTLTACAADVTIGFGTYFAHPEASVGTHVSVGAYCVIGRTRIGERTQVASHVQIVSGRHQHVRGAGGRVEEGSYRQVVVGPDCWIGSGAILMANVGARVTIGAGAVVTKEFPEGVVAAGNPARVLTGC